MGVVVSLDCMGGSLAPHAPMSAAEAVMSEDSDIRFILVGDREKLLPILDKSDALSSRASIVHAPAVVLDDARPSVAMRNSHGTSMRVALEQVRDGAASCMVSAGNTGALMAISLVLLRTIEGVDRPAILVIIPGVQGQVVLLDAGANVSCDSRMLAQFAALGSAWSQKALGVNNPNIALLNIGSEETKGSDTIREAAASIRSVPSMNFVGYVEPKDVVLGAANVVVCDGLLGNVMLKSFEAALWACMSKLKGSFVQNLYSKLIGALAKPVIKAGFKDFDIQNTRGGIIAGLNGVVIKTHGASDASEYARAISSAVYAVQHDIGASIASNVGEVNRILDAL